MICVGILKAQTKKDIIYLVKEKGITMCTERPVADFTVSIFNSTGYNFIMYGFKNPVLLSPSLDSTYILNNFKINAPGNRIFLIDEKFNRADIWLNIPSAHDDNFNSEYFLDSFRKKIKIKNINAMEILGANSHKEVTLKLDLTDAGPIEKGKYWFYLIYACGDLSKSFIDPIDVEKDLQVNNAIVFNGYIVSEPVKLIIK